MQKKQFYLFHCIFLLFLLGGIHEIGAQCSSSGKNLAFTLSQTPANCKDGTITVRLSAGSVTATGYAKVSVQLEGAMTTQPDEFTTAEATAGEKTCTLLASGTYTVSVIGYCDDAGTEKGETRTGTITVGGSYTMYDPGITIERLTLPGKNTGIANITFRGGREPYAVTIKNSSNVQIASYSNQLESDVIKLEDLAKGTYTATFADDCNTTLSRTFEVKEISGSFETEDFLYVDRSTTDCQTLNLLFLPQSTSVGLDKYAVDLTTLNTYFEFEYYYNGTKQAIANFSIVKYTEDDLSRPGNKIYKAILKVDSYTNAIGKKFELKIKIKGTSTYLNSVVSYGELQNDGTSEILLPLHNYFGHTNYSKNNCTTTGIKVPNNKPVEESYHVFRFICLPVTYTINENDFPFAQVGSGTYSNWGDPQNEHDLPTGVYKISFTDANGRTWDDKGIQLTNDFFNAPASTPKHDIQWVYRSVTPEGCIGSPDDDDCLPFYACFYFSNNIPPEGSTVEYVSVPSGFYLPAGTIANLPSPEEKLNDTSSPAKWNPFRLYDPITKLPNYLKCVPGKYVFKFTGTCPSDELEYIVNITSPELDFKYDMVPDCSDMKLKPLATTTMSVSGKNISPIYVRIVDIDGNTTHASSSWTEINGTNILSLPIEGKYKLAFSDKASGLNRGGDMMYRYVTITKTQPEFDDKKTMAYICPESSSGAVITTQVEKGTAPYTYVLYKNGTKIAASESTLGSGLLYSYLDTSGTVTDEYKIEVTDYCTTKIERSIKPTNLAGKLHIRGQVTGCPGDDITIKATYIPGITYKWEYCLTETGTYTDISSRATANELPISNFQTTDEGWYRVTFNITNCSPYVQSQQIKAAPQVAIWQGTSTEWDDENNWVTNLASGRIPAACTDVYIPGNVANFPLLIEDGANICRNIYFLPGSQLGQPQFLEYTQAYIQLDLGAGSQTQVKYTGSDLSFAQIGRDAITWENRHQFGAAKSKGAIGRDRWYMLSSPLHGVWTGDLAFGGYPFAYTRKFKADGDNSGSFISGRWSNYYSSMIEPFNAAEGFVYWVNGYQNKERYYDTHAGYPRPGLSGNTTFGLATLNGILELPYFDNDEISKRHRNHEYNSGTNTSTFHYFWQSPITSEYFLKFSGEKQPSKRSALSNRFIGEDENKKMLETLSYGAGNFDANDLVLVGNPYMSALDFDKFYEQNKAVIKPGYQIWTGTTMNAVSASGTKIAPMQSFLVETKAAGNVEIQYKPADMTTVATSSSMKAQATANGVIDIALSNENGTTSTHIKYNPEANDLLGGWDMSKVIEYPIYQEFAEVYSIAFDTKGTSRALVVNSLKSNNLAIPLGFATTYSGALKLELSGMNNYDAKVQLVDLYLNKEYDLTGLPSFEYTFTHTSELDSDGAGMPTEDRFIVNLSPSNATDIVFPESHTGLSAYASGDCIVAVSSSSDLISEISIYDVKGECLFRQTKINSAYCKTTELSLNSGVYIVSVKTEQGKMKNFKTIK